MINILQLFAVVLDQFQFYVYPILNPSYCYILVCRIMKS